MALIHHPPTIINAYLASKINPAFELDTQDLELKDEDGNIVDIVPGTTGTTYFFPTLPTDIEN